MSFEACGFLTYDAHHSLGKYKAAVTVALPVTSGTHTELELGRGRF